MKKKEFERLLATKGWRLGGSSVLNSRGSRLVTVDGSEVCEVDSFYTAFSNLPHEDKKLLLKWTVEYSLTPIEERKEEKKYYYVLPYKYFNSFINNNRYLNYHAEGEFFAMASDMEGGNYQTKFTDREMKCLLNNFNDKELTNLIGALRKVEVE